MTKFMSNKSLQDFIRLKACKIADFIGKKLAMPYTSRDTRCFTNVKNYFALQGLKKSFNPFINKDYSKFITLFANPIYINIYMCDYVKSQYIYYIGYDDAYKIKLSADYLKNQNIKIVGVEK